MSSFTKTNFFDLNSPSKAWKSLSSLSSTLLTFILVYLIQFQKNSRKQFFSRKLFITGKAFKASKLSSLPPSSRKIFKKLKLKKSSSTHQMKSLQWLQNVGCLKKRGMKRWSLTLYTFFFFSAPFLPRLRRANLLLSWSFSTKVSSSAMFPLPRDLFIYILNEFTLASTFWWYRRTRREASSSARCWFMCATLKCQRLDSRRRPSNSHDGVSRTESTFPERNSHGTTGRRIFPRAGQSHQAPRRRRAEDFQRENEMEFRTRRRKDFFFSSWQSRKFTFYLSLRRTTRRQHFGLATGRDG